MNITKLAALAIAAIVVTGCATNTSRTAQFNPNNKGIHFFDGKPYLIPYGATIGKLASSKDIAVLDKLQISYSCKIGDLRWAERQFFQAIMSTVTSDGGTTMSEEEVADTFRTGIRTQRMGCSSALSATEYDYYKTVQVQRAQQVRHQQNLSVQKDQFYEMQRSNRRSNRRYYYY